MNPRVPTEPPPPHPQAGGLGHDIEIMQRVDKSAYALNVNVALVTGSTSGIGLRMARAVAAAGAEIVLNGFGRPEDISAARARIEQEFRVNTLYHGADMSKPAKSPT